VTLYVPILIWSLAYNLVSIAIGLIATRVFHFPNWVTTALTFNNTTSLLLLLVQSLTLSGALS